VIARNKSGTGHTWHEGGKVELYEIFNRTRRKSDRSFCAADEAGRVGEGD